VRSGRRQEGEGNARIMKKNESKIYRNGKRIN
jgi:hypothetical protein